MKLSTLMRIKKSGLRCAQGLRMLAKDLSARGLVSELYPQKEEIFSERVEALPDVLYAGFDPTADSLHVGHLLVLTALFRSASLFGCSPIALVGGATGQIAIPAAEKKRTVPMEQEIARNTRSIFAQISDLSSNASNLASQPVELKILNNEEWFSEMNCLEFLKQARGFRVGEMMRRKAIQSRMKSRQGLSFTEFAYQIMQALDWKYLSERHNCFAQMGGSDQLGNCEAGYDHIHTATGKNCVAMYLPLLLNKSGQKLGKSRDDGSATWLAPQKTSPLEFYQFFRQLHDDQAESLLRSLSLRTLAEVEEILRGHREALGKWVAQKALAAEITSLVHGSRVATLAEQYSRVLYAKHAAMELQIVPLEMNIDELKTLFGGESAIFRLKKGSVQTIGELADAVLKTNQGSDSTTAKDSSINENKFPLKINGEKFHNPAQKIELEKLVLAGEFSFLSWGRKSKMRVIHWI